MKIYTLSEPGGRLHRERVERLNHAIPEMSPVATHLRGLEQRVTRGLDATPVARRKLVLVALKPERDRRSYLRRRGRGAFAVESYDRAAHEARPGDVRRVGGDGRLHRGVRAEAAFERVEAGEFSVRAAVGHHAADGYDARVARRVDERARRRDSYVVAGRGADDDARLVSVVYLLRPRARGHAAHAQGYYVAAAFRRVSYGLRERARAQEHDAVRDAQG